MRVLAVLIALTLAFTLTACDSAGPGSGSDDSGGEGGGTENEAPSVNFSYSPQNPRAGTSVDFTANASDPDGEIRSYSWDFDGDGNQDASGPNPTYSFDRAGQYSASLTVTDDDGASRTAGNSVSIRQRYTQVRVTQVDLIEMPFTTESGQGWDAFSGPDVYIEVRDGLGEFVAESGYYLDIGPSDLPLSYSETPFTIDNLEEDHSINIYDSDTTNDDFIGGVVYSYDNLIGQYPNNFTLDAGEGITYEVSLEWLE